MQTKIQERLIPEQKKFEINSNRVRDIDINAPVIIGNVENMLRIQPNKIITDSLKHKNSNVQK